MYAEDYIQNDVTTNDPVELVCLLYSKAIERLHLARTRLTEGNSAGCSESVARAMEIVLELIGSLDVEKGGEIAQNLAALYLYVQEQLAEASTEQKSEPIDNAVGVLTTLLEGWKDCRSALLVNEMAAHTQPELAGEAAAPGRAWTL